MLNVLFPIFVRCYVFQYVQNVNLPLGLWPQMNVFHVQLFSIIVFYAQMILCVNNVKTTTLRTCTTEPASNALILTLNAMDAHMMELE